METFHVFEIVHLPEGFFFCIVQRGVLFKVNDPVVHLDIVLLPRDPPVAIFVVVVELLLGIFDDVVLEGVVDPGTQLGWKDFPVSLVNGPPP